MESLVEKLKECRELMARGIKEGAFPEVSRMYIERLGRSIDETLNVLGVVLRENTIQTPISPSSRSAMYNLRRAFYAVLSRLQKERGVDRNLSTSSWKEAAGKIIDFINQVGISEAPIKIVLTYSIADAGGKKFMKLEKAEIFYYQLEGIRELELQGSE